MNNKNLNAVASQLAVDASYYEHKALECWDVINQLDNWKSSDTISLSILNGKDATKSAINLPIEANALTTLNDIFMALLVYYRGKYAKAMQELQLLKMMEIAS